jgi:hypothetical protein
VYWGTVFGEAYVRHFGALRLRQAPAALVEELRDDLFYLQLTDRIEDCVTDWESVRQQRIAVKRHLGEDSFFLPDGDRTYRVPEFHFLD